MTADAREEHLDVIFGVAQAQRGPLHLAEHLRLHVTEQHQGLVGGM